MLTGILGSLASYIPIMALEVFGKNIRIEKDFFHPSLRGERKGRAASFFVDHLDDFIQ